jgi:hypothetical protein
MAQASSHDLLAILVGAPVTHSPERMAPLHSRYG